MGKQSRTKRERKEQPVEPLVETSVTDNLPSPSRRKWVLGGALAAAGVGGTALYHQQKGQADAQSDAYLSVNEAAEIYKQLDVTVRERFAAAKKQHKPFRIAVLENHDSANAVAYEMMLVDIASRLGIRTLLPETGMGSAATSDLPQKDETKLNRQMRYLQTVVRFAQDRNFTTIEDIDTRFATQNDLNDYYYARTKMLAETELKRRFGGAEFNVVIKPSKDINNVLFDFTLESNAFPPLNGQQQQEAGNIISTARKKAYAMIDSERNDTMIATIHKQRSAVMLMGIRHGEGVIGALRDAGEQVLAFNVVEPSLDKSYKNSDLMTAWAERQIQWAENPVNAVQHKGKDFDPAKVEPQVKRAIDKAQGSFLTR